MKEKVREIIERYGKELLKYPNVVGFSNLPQPRIRRGRVVPEEKVLRVYVTRKVPKEQLKPSEIIPPEIDGVKTDVVPIGRIRKMQGFRERYRPAPAGVSTSRADQTAAGTIGWFMVDEDGQIYLLSNNHVWAKENSAVQGDKIVQPGVLDGGDPEADVIAELYSWIDIDFSGNPNTVDAAIATPVDLSIIYTSIMVLGGVTGKADPVQDSKVRKVGRSTGLTEGVITDVSATLNVDYDSGTALFQDVFIVQSSDVIVQGGDSGSPVLSEDGKFLGLLFAGSDDGRTFVACKASNIESAFQQKLNKKIWVLLANSWPPFQKEIQKVYPSFVETMALSLNMIFQYTFMILVLTGVLKWVEELK